MNDLHFSEGGQPISLDDLKQLNDNINEGLALIAKLCGDGILDGCRFGGTITPAGARTLITAGHVIIEGIIYEVEATEILFEGRGLGNLPSEIYIVPSTDKHRTMEFSDGSSHPTRVTRKAQIVRERPTDGRHFAFKLSGIDNINPRPFIPRVENSQAEEYIISRNEEEVGYMNLFHIHGLPQFHACELHINADNKIIREIDSSTHEMYTLKGKNAKDLNITLSSVVDIVQETPYDINIVGGTISLRKGGTPVSEFDGKGLNAFGIIKTYYSAL